MKKNRMMRLASLLLVCVLLTTSVISGTFAKYTTSGKATDSARVAKWGVNVTAAGTTFANAYGDTVLGQGGVKVVAPGTNGSLANVEVTGVPEVTTKVSYDAEVTLNGWTLDGTTEYCPIIFTINGTDYSIWGRDVKGYEALIESAIESITNTYAPGTDLSTVVEDDLGVSWRWDFEAALLPGYQTDANDTALGNRANDGNAPTITLTVKTTIEQVD